MYINITETMFIEQFRIMGRKDQFSYDGLRALFEFLEEMEESTGQDIELDVIALCCEFYEMGWDEVKGEYGNMIDQEEWDDCEDAEDKINTMLEFLNDETMVVYYDDDKVLFQVF